ncbi:acyl-CoA dehydrogenase family protein [Enemella sp. A6]|uniref:acyl-CoA dehydrogenase family protein n=1 Tax=Enemella sp. A6 TaxID=3440152 RepID=UPI003EB8D7BC
MITPVLMDETDEQEALRETVIAILDKHADSEKVRKTSEDPEVEYDARLWERLATELGATLLLVPEDQDGLGMGWQEASIVLEELGRRLVPSPLLTTLVAHGALAFAGAPQLADLAAEATPMAVVTEGVTAEGEALNGAAKAVIGAGSAEVLLVIADDAVWLVPTETDGVTITRRASLDQTRPLAEVAFANAAAQRIGGAEVADRLRQLLRSALATDSAAGADRILEITVEYLKVRQQFGQPIGKFQALKHRVADLLVEVQGAAATAQYAVKALDEGAEDVDTVTTMAKAVAADAYYDTAADAIQLHGGIGFTWEHDCHMYFKRAKANQWLGESNSTLRAKLREAVAG